MAQPPGYNPESPASASQYDGHSPYDRRDESLDMDSTFPSRSVGISIPLRPTALSPQPNSTVGFGRTIFEGSPSYKRRRLRQRHDDSPTVFEPDMEGRSENLAHLATSHMRSMSGSPDSEDRSIRSGETEGS
jgi:hypothetical protein